MKSKIISWTVGVFALLFGYGMVYAAMNPEGTVDSQASYTQAAQDNTFKNVFVSACVDEASTTISEEESQSYCSCGYDELVQMYPDFTTNEERLNRIITEGYNQDETDIMVNCIP